MGCLRNLRTLLWRFMVFFSFVVNLVLVVVLLGLVIFIFPIKNNIADPLIGGLHATAQGLGEATIDWTIPVRTDLPIALDVPINAGTITSTVEQINGVPVAPIPGETVVRLTRPVPLNVSAVIDLPGLNASNVPATVSLTLPEGLNLPVALDLQVSLATEIPVELDVRAVIPLNQTQLSDPIQTLGLLFEPLAIGLHNLPSDFGEVGNFVSYVASGDVDLLATDGSGFNAVPYDAWEGYSRTAGLNYTLFDEEFPIENIPIETGLNPPGGIPFLDAQIRPNLYDENGQRIQSGLGQVSNLPPETYDGSIGQVYTPIEGGGIVVTPEVDSSD